MKCGQAPSLHTARDDVIDTFLALLIRVELISDAIVEVLVKRRHCFDHLFVLKKAIDKLNYFMTSHQVNESNSHKRSKSH